MAQLGINLNFLIAQIIHFIILIVVLRLLLYKPVLNMLAARRQRIQDSLAEADRVRQEAATARQEYERQLEEERRRSYETAQKSIQEAQKARESIIAEAQKEAEAIRARARAEAERERTQVLSELREQVADLAMQASERIVRTTLDEAAQRKIVNDFLTQIEAQKN